MSDSAFGSAVDIHGLTAKRSFDGRWFDPPIYDARISEDLGYVEREATDPAIGTLPWRVNRRYTPPLPGDSITTTDLGAWPTQANIDPIFSRLGDTIMSWQGPAHMVQQRLEGAQTWADITGLTLAEQESQDQEYASLTYSAYICPAHTRCEMASLEDAPSADYESYAINGIPATEIEPWGQEFDRRVGQAPVASNMFSHFDTRENTIARMSRTPAVTRLFSSSPDEYTHLLSSTDWQMFYTYSEAFIGDFSEEIWNTHHVHSSLILLDQPPTSRQSYLNFPSYTADYAFTQPMHLVPQIDGTARFTRHPSEPWRIVPAWNSTYGCNIMYAAKPDNGRLRFSLDHAGDVSDVIFSASALANNGSGGGEAFDVFKDSIPGVKWDGFRVDEIVLPLCYIHHNGHAAEGPGSRNGVGVYAEIPTDAIDEQISGDYAIEIVAYRPKIGPHPE